MDAASPLLWLLIGVQLVAFVVLILLVVRLVKVIKSQNNGRLLPPDISQKLRRKSGKGPKG